MPITKFEFQPMALQTNLPKFCDVIMNWFFWFGVYMYYFELSTGYINLEFCYKHFTTSHPMTVLKLGQFAMPETRENRFGLVISCVYYARQTRNIYLTQWISKLPGRFEIHWVRTYWVKVVLFRIKDLCTSEMMVKHKRYLYVGPVNIFLIFDTAMIYTSLGL